MKLNRIIFNLMLKIGKPFGGFRPFRLINWVAGKSFSHTDNYIPIRTYWGSIILGNPFYHIDRSVLINGCYDKPLHLLLEHKVRQGMTIFDIGANIGEVSLHLASLTGSYGNVISFEPNKNCIERLNKNIAINNFNDVIKVEQIALSDKKGIASFSYADINIQNQGMGSLINFPDDVLRIIDDVIVDTLDNYVLNNSINKIDLIKIDIQGGEIAFLNGALLSIKKFHPDLIMEISEVDLASLGLSSKDLIFKIADLGYRIFEIRKNTISEIDLNKVFEFRHDSLINVYCTQA
jgi:FkbM family methyltransferase